jgi:hypothetical protein
MKEGVNDMALADDKKTYLQKLGFSVDEISELEKKLADSSKTLADAGVEYKEETIEEEEVVEETVEEEPELKEETTEAAPTPNVEAERALEMAELLSPLVSAIQDMGQRLGTIEAEVKELKVADEQKVAELKEETPQRSMDSLRDLLQQTLVGDDTSARLDGRSALAKDGPVEAETPLPTGTPVRMLNRIMSKQRE